MFASALFNPSSCRECELGVRASSETPYSASANAASPRPLLALASAAARSAFLRASFFACASARSAARAGAARASERAPRVATPSASASRLVRARAFVGGGGGADARTRHRARARDADARVGADATGDARAMGVVGAIASLCVGTNAFVRAVTRDGGDDSRASDAMTRVMTMGRSVGASRCPARRARRGARRELARGDRRTNRRGVDVAREATDEADARARDDGSRSTLAFDFRAHEACVRAALVAAGSRDDAAAAEATKTTTTKTNETLGVTTTTEVWSTSRFRRVRSTYVDGGELAQIYNCVVYPSPAACDAPMLGVDLISLGKGAARKVLIGVDLHPMSRDREYASAYVPALEALRRGPGKVADAAAALGATTPSKKFYRDATFFSRGIFFARPERADEETMTRSLDVVRAYVDAWTARLDEAEREAEAMDGACKFGLALEDVRRCVLTEEAARDAQDAHDAWQLAHDPAIPMFAKWYGEEWAREFAETVLFPGARERLASS